MEKRGFGKRYFFGAVLLLVMLALLFYVFAADEFHSVIAPNIVNEDVWQVLNITITVDDTGLAANKTWLNITFPTNFTFVIDSNLKVRGNFSEASFSNTSSMLIWQNASVAGFIKNASEASILINASGYVPGLYNLSIRTTSVNSVNAIANNTPINVTDVIAPSVSYTTPANNTIFGSTSFTFNCSTTDDGTLVNTTLYIYNSSTGALNPTSYTNISGSNGTGQWTKTLHGDARFTGSANYTWNCIVRDTLNNRGFVSTNRTITVNTGRLTGKIYLSNGSVSTNTNVTVYELVQSFGASPPTLNPIASRITNLTGSYNLPSINITPTLFKVTFIHYNGSNNNVSAIEIGPTMPPMPAAAIQASLENATVTLGPAATLNLYAHQGPATNQTSLDFGYYVFDLIRGKEIDMQIRANKSSASVVVSRNRNYTVIQLRDPQLFGTTPFSASPPTAYTVNNISDYAVSDYNITINQNLNVSEYTINGFLKVTGNRTAVNTTYIVIRILPVAGFVPPMEERNTEPTLLKAAGTGGTGEWIKYNLTVMGSSSGVNYLAEFYANGTNTIDNESFVALQNFTVTADIARNITLVRAVGNFNDTVASGPNATKYLIKALDADGNAIRNGMAMLTLVDNDVFGTLKYILQEVTDGTFMQAIPSNIDQAYIEFFDKGTAPKKVYLDIAGTNYTNTTLRAFRPEKFLANGSIEAFNNSATRISFYKENSTCSVVNPSAGCAIAGTGTYQGAAFNPMQLMFSGSGINMYMEQLTSNVIVYFVNVDMIASGPPDARTTEDPLKSGATSATSLEQAMRFGSLGPTVYDKVWASWTYNTSVNEAWAHTLQIKLLYNQDGRLIWNNTVNTTTQIPTEYADYNQTLFSTGVVCSQSNTTELCYMDTTNDRFWVKLPHFSDVGASVTSSVSAAAATTAASSAAAGGRSSAASETTSYTWSSLSAGQDVVFKVAQENFEITELKFSVNKDLSNVKLSVERFADVPEDISPIDNAYKYFAVNGDNIDIKNDIGPATVKFRVENSWAEDYEDVGLYKYNEIDKEWSVLYTKQVDKDIDYTYYEADTKGFSYFVIVGIKAEIPEIEAKEGAAEEEIAEEEVPRAEEASYWWIAAIVIIAAVVLYLLFKPKKKRFAPKKFKP